MPWEHCETTIRDDQTCPECGITKEQWTVEFNVTRQFTLSTAPSLSFVLLRASDEGVAGEPYKVEWADETVEEGELDGRGSAKLKPPKKGACTITFPERSLAKVRWVNPPEPAEGEESETASEEEPSDEEPASFECEPGRKLEFWLTVPLKLRLKFCGEKLDEQDYILRVAERDLAGQTDGEGNLTERVPEAEEEAVLVLAADEEGENGKELPLAVGQLAPLEETAGVQGRLNNLSYLCGEVDGEFTPRTQSALTLFQADHDLEPSGELDDATRDKLAEVYGGTA